MARVLGTEQGGACSKGGESKAQRYTRIWPTYKAEAGKLDRTVRTVTVFVELIAMLLLPD
jgi:hypothetical protein